MPPAQTILGSIRRRLARRGVRPVDAFRAMDADRDGRVGCAELYGGLEWLGVRASPDDVYAIVRHVDSSGEGRIAYDDFRAAFASGTV